MHQFKELKVWQKGRELVKEIYLATHKFPQDELFGITSQMSYFEIQKMIYGLKQSILN